MRRSKIQVYLHLVWGTWERQPFLSHQVERSVYRCIEDEARRLKCKVLSLGGTSDHIHMVVWLPATLALATLVKQVKGVSSKFVHGQFPDYTLFKWQEGYGAFSITPSHLKKVIAYVDNQKEHHASGTLAHEWEETDEEAIDTSEPY